MSPTRPKLMVVGHARHGKDTVCEMMAEEYGYTFISSSLFLTGRVIRPMLKEKRGIEYRDDAECMARREEVEGWRKLWYDAISKYNYPDPSRLAKELYAGYDMYCGLRSKREFHSLRNQGTFDHSIWVDRSDHLPPEPVGSNTLHPWMTDFIIDNNGTLEDLRFNVRQLMDRLMFKMPTTGQRYEIGEWEPKPMPIPDVHSEKLARGYQQGFYTPG